jgi:23S rRNA pseudouridine1911/1915/1917 synthase
MTARRAVSLPNAREALTDWRVLARIDSTTLLEIQIHTGRTHQIRVHFSALRHPVVGDTLYGASGQLHVGRTSLPALGRNFLHAAKIAFEQPRTDRLVQLTAPLPAELRAYLEKLAAAAGENLPGGTV